MTILEMCEETRLKIAHYAERVRQSERHGKELSNLVKRGYRKMNGLSYEMDLEQARETYLEASKTLAQLQRDYDYYLSLLAQERRVQRVR